MKHSVMFFLVFISVTTFAGPSGSMGGRPVNFEVTGEHARDPGYLVIVKKIEDITPKRANYLVRDPVTRQEFILLISEDQIFVLPDRRTYVIPKIAAGVEI